eukprot:6418241-Lingulodinium_polyedra.AAC.1
MEWNILVAPVHAPTDGRLQHQQRDEPQQEGTVVCRILSRVPLSPKKEAKCRERLRAQDYATV